jgi:hypothetical protein
MNANGEGEWTPPPNLGLACNCGTGNGRTPQRVKTATDMGKLLLQGSLDSPAPAGTVTPANMPRLPAPVDSFREP